MKKRVQALLMATVMIISAICEMGANVSAAGFSAKDVYTPAPDEVIQDPVLHWAVRSAMNSVNLNGQKLTKEMVASPAVRDISFAQCSNPDNFLSKEEWKNKPFWIENLEGLQYATSARMIEISFTNAVEGKKISDLSPLANLTQLEILILKQDGIHDISPLRNLVNLTQLDLYENKEITNVDALANMTKLKSLKLSNNAITNIDAICNLESLEWLAFNNNKVSGLPDLSKLTNVYFLDAENNLLTNSDVEQIAKLRGLTRLNLLENKEVTDYRPLVNLTKLTEETTFLDDETKKADLFAAIEVNKLFEYFNISKMHPEDLQNVEDALTAYENLTEEQKTYFDSNKIAATRSNKELVANGKEPVNYPEYDTAGKNPEFKEINISVVDKYGQPMEGVTFLKKQRSDGSVLQSFTTNEKGKLTITHLPIDNIYGVIAIVPEEDSEGNAIYKAEPSEITYTVSWDKNTKTINGKKATGLEKLKMVLIPIEEYVDKNVLKDALARKDFVEDEYKYTEISYKAYEKALNLAQECFDDPDATEREVLDAANALNSAIDGLAKSDVLTQLKIKVVDTNGNTFHRAFKFQVRIPETDGEEKWYAYTSPYSGVAYLKTSPGWVAGKEWEILACDEEPYRIEAFRATVGVKDGLVYFKTVEGKSVDADYEKTVVATYVPEGASSKIAPDRQMVEDVINSANEINLADYTTTTAANLTKAINAAKTVLEKVDAIQEDYNKVIADMLEAREELVEAANKVWLEEELQIAKTSYTESYYTKASWKAFKELLAKAQATYDDGDATQEQVDQAIDDLKSVVKDILIRRADNSELGELLEKAKEIKADAYSEESFQNLADVITKAQSVYDNDESTKEQIEAQVTELDDAIKSLVKKDEEPVEVDYACTQGVFKAKVVDKNGKPVTGVVFESVINGAVDTTITSDANGILTYQIYGQNNKKVTYIRLADERYITEDEHYFEASGAYDWLTFITSIDGQAYAEGTKLIYVVAKANQETPEPDEDPVCKHEYSAEYTVDETATFTKEGRKSKRCLKCNEVLEGSEKIVSCIKSAKLSKSNYTYNGSAKKPTVTVKDAKGATLKEGTNYSVSYASGRTKIGKYKVTIIFRGDYSGSKNLYFEIGPKNPSSVKTTLYGYDDVIVSWSKVSEASGYKVYYKKSTASSWILLKTTTASSYKKANLLDGVNYDFKVVAYKKVDGNACENVGKTSSIYTLKRVTGVKIVKSNSKVKVSWTNISGETGYQISRSTSKTGTNIVATYLTTNGKHKSVSATKGKTYYYKVRAYKTVNGKKIYGPWSDVKKYKIAK